MHGWLHACACILTLWLRLDFISFSTNNFWTNKGLSHMVIASNACEEIDSFPMHFDFNISWMHKTHSCQMTHQTFCDEQFYCHFRLHWHISVRAPQYHQESSWRHHMRQYLELMLSSEVFPWISDSGWAAWVSSSSLNGLYIFAGPMHCICKVSHQGKNTDVTALTTSWMTWAFCNTALSNMCVLDGIYWCTHHYMWSSGTSVSRLMMMQRHASIIAFSEPSIYLRCTDACMILSAEFCVQDAQVHMHACMPTFQLGLPNADRIWSANDLKWLYQKQLLMYEI